MNISGIKSKIDKTVSSRKLAIPGDRIVVAVSGGVDSVVLLHYLASRADLGLNLTVAHLNHGLRGAESDGDELFVKALSESYGLGFESRHDDVKYHSREKGISLEEAGRECRYSFLSGIAKQADADSVAIAHHQDDQAETVLLRLIRGSGPTGLSAMSHRSADGMYVRPLLDITREETEFYANHYSLSYRTDSSNSDLSFLRNRVRLELLPLLSTYNPAIPRRLAETASIIAADEAIISEMVQKRWQEVGKSLCGVVSVDAGSLRTDLPGLRFRIYRRSIELLKGDLRCISLRHLQSIDTLLLSGPSNGSLDLPSGLKVRRTYNTISFEIKGDPESKTSFEISIAGEGLYPLNSEKVVSVDFCHESEAESCRNEMIVDLARFPFPWSVRQFIPGDRMVPAGMKGHKKIKDLFIDEKIPRDQRSQIPLFFSGDTLFWVGGLRRAGYDTSSLSNKGMAKVRILEKIPDTAILA